MSAAIVVRCLEPDCGARVLHQHSGEDYGLEDIPELFQLGRIVADPADREPARECIRIGADEIRELKVMADAYSFDFAPGLIELCLELHRFAIQRREAEFLFVQEE